MIDAISETAIVAGCTGAAMMGGMRPVAEMQFADYASCAWDNTSSPSRPSGVTARARRRSQCGCRRAAASPAARSTRRIRSRALRIPGLQVVCPATPADAKGLIIRRNRGLNPVLYFEHKHLYRRIKDEVPEERYTVPFGEARVHREATTSRSSPGAQWSCGRGPPSWKATSRSRSSTCAR